MNYIKTILFIIFSGLTNNTHGAAPLKLTPIRADLYSAANITPAQATYWLTIPNTGIVLIAMKKGETIPSLGDNGQANFEYVTDNLSQYQTHFKLPNGLYYWKGTASKHFSNRPIKKNASGQEIGRQFISLKKGYVDAKTKNDIWDQTRFQHNPHPFDVKKISDLIESKPAAKNQSGNAQSIITQFSVATNNILNDKFYRMNINKGTTDSMPLSTRQQLFNAAFEQTQQFKGKDIIALQEWSAQGSLMVPSSYAKSASSSSAGGLFTYYNPTLFTLTHSEYKTFTQAADRGFLVSYLQTTDAQQRKLALINTHFKGGAGPQGNYAAFREKQITDIVNYITQNISQADSWILCGDFNTNSHDDKLYTLLTTPMNSKNNGTITLIDAEGSISKNRPATSYNKGEESMDYIFYTPTTLNTKGSMYYPASKDLITHGHKPGDAQKSFYSDHRIVSALFTFKQQRASTAAHQSEKSNVKTKIELSTATGVKSATAAAGSGWTQLHQQIAHHLKNNTEYDRQMANALIESGEPDLTAKNPTGETLEELEANAYEENLYKR